MWWVGSGFCDELVTCWEESYRVCLCLTMCDLRTSTNSNPSSHLWLQHHRKKVTQSLLTITQIAVGVFFQPLDNAVVSVEWASCRVHCSIISACRRQNLQLENLTGPIAHCFVVIFSELLCKICARLCVSHASMSKTKSV